MKKIFFATLFSGISVSGFCVYNDVDSATFYVTKAIELSKGRKIAEADKSFEKAILFNPDRKDIRIAYGDYLLAQNKSFAAVEQFGKILEWNINDRDALHKLTEISFMLQRWGDVVMYGNKLVQNGGAENVHYMIGKSFYELANYNQSQKYLNAALTENPNKPEIAALLGKVYIELSNYSQAIALYSQSLNLDSNNSQLIYELGMLHYAQNNEKEAIKYFELAAEKGYKIDLDYYENLGLAYLSTDVNKGVEILNKVLAENPDNTDIVFQEAQAYYRIANFEEAAHLFEKVFENDQTNSRALYMAGVAYQKKGDRKKGIEMCEKALEMDPGLAQLKLDKS